MPEVRGVGRGIAVVCVVGAAGMGAALGAGANDAVEVTASALNVRTGPSTSNARTALIRRGQIYPVVARSGSWVQLHLGDETGWSHGGYLRASSDQVMSVTAARLNVRSGASTRYRVLGSLSQGTPVAVSGSSGAWRKISFAGQDAWVHGNYLAAQGGGGTQPPPTTRPRSRAGFIQLAASGPGWMSYKSSARRWGTPDMIYGIERVARRFQRERPGSPRLGVGEISAANGGYLSGHASHRLGVDGDFRPLRNDGAEAPVTIHQSGYSRSLTRRMLELFEAELRVTHIFFNDSQIHTAHRQYWRNHDNHFHVRIRR